MYFSKPAIIISEQNIVAEQPRFDMDGFMPVLKERMYSKSVFARQFHIGWLSALRAVPDSQLLKHLPGILDQLFIILSDDTKEIRTRYVVILIYITHLVEMISRSLLQIFIKFWDAKH